MANTLWVSANSTVPGDGSESNPFANIQDAIDTADPGTTIMVMAGTYTENVEFKRYQSGTDSEPIKLVSADGPGAAILHPSDDTKDLINIDGADNIVISGFVLHGPAEKTEAAVHIHGATSEDAKGNVILDVASNITVDNNIVHRGAGDGIKGSKATDLTLVSNTISGGGPSESGIDLLGVDTALISGNTLYDLDKVGIMLKGGSENIAVVHNTIFNIGHIAIEVGGYSEMKHYPPWFVEAGSTFEVKNVLVDSNKISNSENSAIRLIGAQQVQITDNFFNGKGSEIKIDDSSKFHDLWLSTYIGLTNNKFPASDWLNDRGYDARIHWGNDAHDVFEPWDGLTISLPLPIFVTSSGCEITQPDPTLLKPEPEPEVKSESEPVEELPLPQPSVLRGDDKKNKLEGGDGDDVIYAGDGNDSVRGGDGDDRIFGGLGKDKLRGGDGDDMLNGESGNDKIGGGDGADLIRGGDGDDKIDGDRGNDTLLGGTGNDDIEGGKGDDHLWGDAGDDTLEGGDGDDTLEGGTGDDRLDGEDGADMFIFRANSTGIDADLVEDFEAGEDLIVLLGFGAWLNSFSDLDTNGNSRLDGGDHLVTQNDDTLTLDLSHFYGSVPGHHTIEIEADHLTTDDFTFSI